MCEALMEIMADKIIEKEQIAEERGRAEGRPEDLFCPEAGLKFCPYIFQFEIFYICMARWGVRNSRRDTGSLRRRA